MSVKALEPMQIAPSPVLASLVKHYLILEKELPFEQTYRFFPDGNPGLVFTYEDPLTESSSAGTQVNVLQHFFYGQTNHYYDLKVGKRTGLFIVVFQPWGLYAVTGLSGKQTLNVRLGLDELFGPEAGHLQEQLVAQKGISNRVQLVEAFLRNLPLVSDPKFMVMKQAIHAIQHHGGTPTIRQLSDWSATTERSLERYFDTTLGMSPKSFSRIVRLQSCLKIHRQTLETNSAQLACSAGYYDQAHLIREFTQLTGLTPKQYTSTPLRLAVNLVPLG